MSEIRKESLEVPDPDVLRGRLRAVFDYAERGELRDHEPSTARCWKALDLAHVALHLCGANVWDANSETGGSSVTTNRELASKYLSTRGPLTAATVEHYLGIERGKFPMTKLLVGLSDRLSEHTLPATHFGNEGNDERIATSMRLSDLDEVSRALARRIFELPPTFDTDFVRGHSDRVNHHADFSIDHQGTESHYPGERPNCSTWTYIQEPEIMRPLQLNLNPVIRLPEDIVQGLVYIKEKRSYIDLCGADLSHLKSSVEVYNDLCGLFPKTRYDSNS
jgi:hypothetical protein